MLARALSVTLLAALVALPVVSQAQDRRGQALIGPRLEWYYFSDSRLRNTFGSPVFNVGLGAASAVSSGLDVISASRNGSKLFLVPLTFSVKKDLGGDKFAEVPYQPYVRLAAGVAYYDIAVTVAPGDRRSEKTFGLTGAAELGINVTERLNVYARYNFFQKRAGLDFSGFNFGISYAFFRF